MNITVRIPSRLYENNPGLARERGDQLATREVAQRLLDTTRHTPGEKIIHTALILDGIYPYHEHTNDVAFLYRYAPEVAA